MNNLPDGLPAAKGRMTPTEEVSNDFAETYGSGRGGGGNGNRVSSSSGSNANGSSAAPQAGGALHRNISQGQVRVFKSAAAAATDPSHPCVVLYCCCRHIDGFG